MAKSSKSKKNAESRELLEALTILEKEKNSLQKLFNPLSFYNRK